MATYLGLPSNATARDVRHRGHTFPTFFKQGSPVVGPQVQKFKDATAATAVFIRQKAQVFALLKGRTGATGAVGSIGVWIEQQANNLKNLAGVFDVNHYVDGSAFEVASDEERLAEEVGGIVNNIIGTRPDFLGKMKRVFSDLQDIGQVRKLMNNMVFSMALNLLDARGIKGSRISTKIVNMVIRELGGNVANPETFMSALDQIQDVEMLKRQNTARSFLGTAGELKNLYKAMGIPDQYRPIFGKVGTKRKTPRYIRDTQDRKNWYKRGGARPAIRGTGRDVETGKYIGGRAGSAMDPEHRDNRRRPTQEGDWRGILTPEEMRLLNSGRFELRIEDN